MGRRRRSGVALAATLAFGAGALVVLAVDFVYPCPRLNVAAVSLVVIAIGAWLAWLLIHVHEADHQATLADQYVRQQHGEQRLRRLRSNADSDN